MRRLRGNRNFRVEIAPAVWREIGLVPGDAFKRMQAELENIAHLSAVASEVSLSKTRNVLHRVRVDDHEGIYEVDSEREVVRLVSVHRARR